jgi:hypothetical protein
MERWVERTGHAPTCVTASGSITSTKEVQLLKAFEPIDVAEFGILMVGSAAQPAHRYAPTTGTESGMSNAARDAHPWNAKLPIEVTLFGMMMSSRAVQLAKA